MSKVAKKINEIKKQLDKYSGLENNDIYFRLCEIEKVVKEHNKIIKTKLKSNAIYGTIFDDIE